MRSPFPARFSQIPHHTFSLVSETGGEFSSAAYLLRGSILFSVGDALATRARLFLRTETFWTFIID